MTDAHIPLRRSTWIPATTSARGRIGTQLAARQATHLRLLLGTATAGLLVTIAMLAGAIVASR